MKSARKIIGIVALISLMIFSAPVSALSEADYLKYSLNHILFYDSAGCAASTSSLGGYSDLTIGASYSSNLAEITKQYGLLAMDLQREWGTPWEVVFAQMQMESQVGTDPNSVAAAVAKNGYYNWLGISWGGPSEYNTGEPFQGQTRKWAQYASIENMIRDWAGAYVARNGAENYNKAFLYTDPNNYDMRGFLTWFLASYAPSSDGNDVPAYISGVLSLINGTIKDVREEMGWPSSEELAKQENIPIGGRHPFGTSGSSSSDDSTSSEGGCTKITSSPDYNDSGYQARLSNLHDFSQVYSKFSSEKMCVLPSDNNVSTISGGGCGIMSLFAAFYMFSGQGLNDSTVFQGLLKASQQDGYNLCNQSNTSAFGSNLAAFTQMEKTDISTSWDAIVGELQQGKKALVSSGTEYFTRSTGHILMIDHYNAEKDMVYLFDPAINITKFSSETESRVDKLNRKIAENGAGYIEYFNNNPLDGLYMSRKAFDELLQPRAARALAYDGCYNGTIQGIVNICRATSVFASLRSGGMSYDEAVRFMAAYREEASYKKFGAYGAGYPNGTVIGSGYVGDAGCHDGTLNNCVAFSRWFVNNYTSAGPKSLASGDGWAYAASLVASDGFVDNGTVPLPYAVFSQTGGSWGHTGVVLGVNTEKDEIYIGEAGCTAGYTDTWPGVHVYSLSTYTDATYNYAYPGDKLRL